jgi:hypothetical protein
MKPSHCRLSRLLVAPALLATAVVLSSAPGPVALGQGHQGKPRAVAEDWALEHQEIVDHPEAQLLVRHGSINNFGFGWPRGFDPFAGAATPLHAYPWRLNPKAAEGTDRIMVGSSYRGNPPTGAIDGYTRTTQRPANNPVPITIRFEPPRFPIRSAVLQVFVDDFQAPVWRSKFQVTMNGQRVPDLEEILNALDQTGPVGKLVTFRLPDDIVATLDQGRLTIFVDDPTTRAGDGFAFDFFRLLVNPRGPRHHGILIGTVSAQQTGKPIAGATVSAGGVVKARTRADGGFELRGVPAGHATLSCAASGFRGKTVTADLLAGKTVRVDIRLENTVLGENLIDAGVIQAEDKGAKDKSGKQP